MAETRVCAWCEARVIEGDAGDAGRPLTEEEAEAGFLAVHEECRGKMDALFARLASKGVYVEVTEGADDAG